MCKLFGVSRQSYYQHKGIDFEAEAFKDLVVEHVRALRVDFPRMGYLKLYELCKVFFGGRFSMGREAFYHLLRSRNLMLRLKKRTSRTTDSRHPYYLYPNLACGYKPDAPCRLWVSDITYIPLKEGFCYLSLITDAFSRKVVGWYLAGRLKYIYTELALRAAIEETLREGFDLSGLIHHSDRGVQYAYYSYTDLLKEHHCRISMTQSGDPLENALAERMNGILKQEWLNSREFEDMAQARRAVENAIKLYNERRPHMAIGMKTPQQMHVNPCMVHENQRPLPYQQG